ncbi:hypothetical protein EI94DRAFT_1808079 [Lactarius quietus]|nr:hypothetical protein EI94DRAFT_1808079 [Lactarius quietus]
MAQPSKLAQVQSRQGGANASSSGTSGPAQLSGDTDEPSPFDFLNYVPSPVTEQDARKPQAPERLIPHSFIRCWPSSVNGTATFNFSTYCLVWPAGSTASAVGQSTYAFLDFLPSPLSDQYRHRSHAFYSIRSTCLSTLCDAVPTAATHGVQHTDTSHRWLVVTWSNIWLAAISGAAQCPTAYDFLQHIPASQHMTRDRTASLVRTNMELMRIPNPLSLMMLALKVRKRTGEMEDDSRQELPVPSSTSVPWPEIRIPIHLPQMPAVSSEVAVVLDALLASSCGLLNDMHRLRELMNTMNERLVSDAVVVEYLIAHLTQRE